MSIPPPFVCLVGTGRCGSTLLYNLLARHRSFAWPSGFSNAFPRAPWVALTHRFWRLKDPKDFRGWRGFPKPAEPNHLIQLVLGGQYQVEDPSLLSEQTIITLREHFDSVKKYHGADCIILKVVGFPVRIDLFSLMWSGGKFVHIERDLKPSVSSTLNVDFYSGWGTLDRWEWTPVPAELKAFHESVDECEAVGVAIGLWLQRRRIEDQLGRLDSENVMVIHYADLVSGHSQTMEILLRWLGLPFEEAYARLLGRASVEEKADEKWKQYLSRDQIDNLDAFQERFGY